MKREYSNQDHNENTDFFVGTEVEHTPAYGLKTLFVVGVQSTSEIMRQANALNCRAIYFGANQSFNLPATDDADCWKPWEDMINTVLNHPDDFWCTLDFDVKYAENIVSTELVGHPNFIPMISVKIPYAMQMGYNATVKIDDKDFQASNPGVWCHKLHELMTHDKYTNWKKYKDDQII
jgi:hypothetical protein